MFLRTTLFQWSSPLDEGQQTIGFCVIHPQSGERYEHSRDNGQAVRAEVESDVSRNGRSSGVCERAVWQLVRDGQLPALRIGRSVRIPLAAIHDFIEVNTGRP